MFIFRVSKYREISEIRETNREERETEGDTRRYRWSVDNVRLLLQVRGYDTDVGEWKRERGEREREGESGRGCAVGGVNKKRDVRRGKIMNRKTKSKSAKKPFYYYIFKLLHHSHKQEKCLKTMLCM